MKLFIDTANVDEVLKSIESVLDQVLETIEKTASSVHRDREELNRTKVNS